MAEIHTDTVNFSPFPKGLDIVKLIYFSKINLVEIKNCRAKVNKCPIDAVF